MLCSSVLSVPQAPYKLFSSFAFRYPGLPLVNAPHFPLCTNLNRQYVQASISTEKTQNMLCRRGYIGEIPPSKKRNDMSRGISVKEAKKEH
jgi:hypothetical protein